MAVLTLLSALALASSAVAVVVPEEISLMIAASGSSTPVTVVDSRKFPCEDRFSANVLNGIRRSAVSLFKKSIDEKKVSKVDGLILLSALDEKLVDLDSKYFEITSKYHTDCAACAQDVPCCLAHRAIWSRHAIEAYDSSIGDLCSKAASLKIEAAECEPPLKAFNPSNDIADILRCEAECKYTVYSKEPICATNYK